MATEKNIFSTVMDEVDAPKVAKPQPKARELSSVDLDVRQKTLAQVYSAQKKYTVRIAPSYAKHFGNIMRVIINGIAIAVRCDGGNYNLPEEYAAEVERRMRAVDEMDMKSRKMGDIKNNYEPDIGHLNFF